VRGGGAVPSRSFRVLAFDAPSSLFLENSFVSQKNICPFRRLIQRNRVSRLGHPSGEGAKAARLGNEPSSCKKRLAIERTRSCRALHAGSSTRRRSCSVQLPDSRNYLGQVNADDIDGREAIRIRSADAGRSMQKMSQGNLLQGYNCK